MRTINASNQALLESRQLVARDFLVLTARDRITGDPVEDYLWSDVGECVAQVLNPDGGAGTHLFMGSGTLVQISDIPLVSNVTIQTVTIVMSQVSDRVNQLVRTYDCKQAGVKIYRGLYNPSTRVMTAAAECRFVGFVDTIEITTASENDEGAVTLTCKSHSQELTRSNPETRSLESQKIRSATDDFHKDASVVGEWEHFWGKVSGKADATGGKGSSSGGATSFADGDKY